MATGGKLLDRKEAQHYMDYYFVQMKEVRPRDLARPRRRLACRRPWPCLHKLASRARALTAQSPRGLFPACRPPACPSRASPVLPLHAPVLAHDNPPPPFPPGRQTAEKLGKLPAGNRLKFMIQVLRAPRPPRPPLRHPGPCQHPAPVTLQKLEKRSPVTLHHH